MSFTHTDQPSLRKMCDYAARAVVNTIADVQQDGSPAHLVLTGGTAGIETCRRLLALHQAAEQQRESFPIAAINWQITHVYFGDERNVAVSHPDSNEGQAREALLDYVPIPAENIHSYSLDGNPDEAYLEEKAQQYAQLLPEHFDVHLLALARMVTLTHCSPATLSLQRATRSSLRSRIHRNLRHSASHSLFLRWNGRTRRSFSLVVQLRLKRLITCLAMLLLRNVPLLR